MSSEDIIANMERLMAKCDEDRQKPKKLVFIVPGYFKRFAKKYNMTEEEFVDHVYGGSFKHDVDVVYTGKTV